MNLPATILLAAGWLAPGFSGGTTAANVRAIVKSEFILSARHTAGWRRRCQPAPPRQAGTTIILAKTATWAAPV